MDDNTKKELQSAAFERLISHLRKRKDVQNIDLMNLAGFCRILGSFNASQTFCFSKLIWYDPVSFINT